MMETDLIDISNRGIKDAAWSTRWIKLLLQNRLEREENFQLGEKSKRTLWREIHREMKAKDSSFSFSSDDVQRKFVNLMTTYKRIKKRNSSSGREATIWPYFEIFDEVYGTKHFIEPP